MNTKKWIALLLALLTAFAMVGCGDNNTDQPIDIGPAETPAPTEAPDSGLGLAQPAAPVGMVAAGSIHTVGLRADGTAVSAGPAQGVRLGKPCFHRCRRYDDRRR